MVALLDPVPMEVSASGFVRLVPVSSSRETFQGVSQIWGREREGLVRYIIASTSLL